MQREKTLHDLFMAILKDTYFSEKQVVHTLRKMASTAQNGELRLSFERHRAQAKAHVQRLEEIFEQLGEAPSGRKCEGIVGIVEDGIEIVEELDGANAVDVGLISAAQALEHYEMARYGTLKAWASQLGFDNVAALLNVTLHEIILTDKALTDIALRRSNRKAA